MFDVRWRINIGGVNGGAGPGSNKIRSMSSTGACVMVRPLSSMVVIGPFL